MTPKALLPLCLALLLPAVGHAQYQMVSPMLYEGPRISLQGHAATTGSPTPQPAPAPAARPLDASALAFRPDLARRRANLAAFVARSRATDRAAGDSLAQLFAQGDIIERLKPELAKYGLTTDNFADAYATWWICAWQASQGDDREIRPPVARAVRDQVLASAGPVAPRIAAAPDAEKQTLAESLLIQAMLLDAALDQAKADPAQLQQVKTGALQAGRGMGVDLARMTLTDQGFVTR